MSQNNTNGNRRDVYFGTLAREEIGSELMKRVEDYRNFLRVSGRIYLWRRLYDMYYKEYWLGGRNFRTGEEGEYLNTCINHFRNLLLHLKTLITQQRPAFEARAINTDVKSQEQTILANGVLAQRERDCLMLCDATARRQSEG